MSAARFDHLFLSIVVSALVACAWGCKKSAAATAPERRHVAGPPASAPFGFGRRATEEEVLAWRVEVLPDGTGLPPGQGTAIEGEAIYAARCAGCHGPRGEGASAPALVAGPKPAQGYRIGRAPRDARPTWVEFVPYATTLFDYTRRAMPYSAPGSLRDDETYGVVAWMLHANGLVSSERVLNRTSLPRLKMPARERFEYESRR